MRQKSKTPIIINNTSASVSNMKNKILRLALENAIRYNGKASIGSTIGKLLSEEPGLKKKIAIISKEVKDAVEKVNNMKTEEQLKEFERFGIKLKKEKKERVMKLPCLKKFKKPVVLRFEPSPSGPLHIGHAYVLGLNSEYAKTYNGKLILRIADTNPRNINAEAYQLIPEDAQWLTGNNLHEVIVQSDRMELYYDYALKFLGTGHAYICTCPAAVFQALAKKMEECPCRSNPIETNIKRWHSMFTTFQQGEAVMRLKTDMKHKNPAMRDFPLMRINEDEHPRKGRKYRVWPLMNFAVMVDDHDSSITHILRAKDHTDNAKRQEMMYKYFGWFIPETIFVGRINFKGLDISCTKTRKKIDDGLFWGWDDIRIPFLPALRRRGYQPEALVKYAKSVGVTLNDKTVAEKDFFKTIEHFNREIVEPKANRYFFIEEPKLISIENAQPMDTELDLHPDHRKGGRWFHTKGSFYVSGKERLEKGKIYRLMDCLNFEVKKNKYVFHSAEYEKVKGKAQLIHWLPEDEWINVEVLMPDNTIAKGIGERLLNDLKEGDIVQFPRFGFCRLDRIEEDKLVFWFAHK